MERYGIALFFSTRDAMKAEEEAKKCHLRVRIIPTPGTLYASCGFSLKYEPAEETALQQLLRTCGLRGEGFYHAVKQGLAVSYEKAEER
ncbi:hypothetical protein AB840_07340 [Megasphaera cerevisiae DSM 20462]|jgi:hypothetical protein|uniref:Putative Se/S carrier protein-like domain-containing protein n=1 Tax=Megasphaera cerevisiae DSM 20462 TaxID=1122219 RepID=A0A0J6WXQ0_9FIRM|nr:DUF3343 domain-containing protein [Megasphaera cerevisiae]KMO86612.1 hypothetical protein AB840_07340 [Megasphaera cerevisiae DSM 20462]OKY53251.1 hypothetical protein BSR42_08385 [Megasphaera cerevisiae]SJZ70198.1 Protein of unknown function [Megasphaera cerevisiae DSM 20462]